MTNYKELEIYHLSQDLVLKIYDLCKVLPNSEDNNLISQLRRAVTCLPLNIAEALRILQFIELWNSWVIKNKHDL